MVKVYGLTDKPCFITGKSGKDVWFVRFDDRSFSGAIHIGELQKQIERRANVDRPTAAERLAVSQASVYRLIESGSLLAHRIGVGRGTLRISEEQLEQFLTDSETEVIEPRPRQRKPRLNHIQL